MYFEIYVNITIIIIIIYDEFTSVPEFFKVRLRPLLRLLKYIFGKTCLRVVTAAVLPCLSRAGLPRKWASSNSTRRKLTVQLSSLGLDSSCTSPGPALRLTPVAGGPGPGPAAGDSGVDTRAGGSGQRQFNSE